MVERIYDTKDDNKEQNQQHVKLCSSVITKESLQEKQKAQLLEVLQFLFLNNSQCLHDKLEKFSCSPMHSTMTEEIDPCENSCPNCSKEMNHCMHPVRKLGLEEFLAHAFITCTDPEITAKLLVEKLQKFPEVESKVHGRQRSVKPPENKYLHTTISQLIASNLIAINCTNDKPNAALALGMAHASPSYLIDDKWDGFAFAQDNN